MFAACGTAVADICWPLSRSFDSIFTCIWKFSPLSGLHCGKSSADEKQMRLPAFVIIQIDCNLVDSFIYLLLLSFILNSGSGYFHCVCVCVELLLFRFWMEGRRGGRGGGASCYGIPKESAGVAKAICCHWVCLEIPQELRKVFGNHGEAHRLRCHLLDHFNNGLTWFFERCKSMGLGFRFWKQLVGFLNWKLKIENWKLKIGENWKLRPICPRCETFFPSRKNCFEISGKMSDLPNLHWNCSKIANGMNQYLELCTETASGIGK